MLELIVSVAALLFSTVAAAHDAGGAEVIRLSAVDGTLAALLGGSAVLYAIGLRALWRKAGAGRGIRYANAICFALGWTVLAVALLSPIDKYADRSFALHMVQHELLMIVAAPLLVMARPLEAFAWALPSQVARVVARSVRVSPVRWLWLSLTAPLGAWLVHAVALWMWHLPVLFKAALVSLPVHVAQHICFFVSALGFWWAAFGGREGASAASVASLFTTMLHTSALGALLTFAPTAWYSLGSDAAFGLTPLEDQQLGGLVMWVPGGFAYLIAGLVIVRRWLSPSPRTRSNTGIFDQEDSRIVRLHAVSGILR